MVDALLDFLNGGIDLVAEHGGIGHKIIGGLRQGLKVFNLPVQLFDFPVDSYILFRGVNIRDHASLGHPGTVRHPVAQHAAVSLVND